jgi:hypothetical protein
LLDRRTQTKVSGGKVKTECYVPAEPHPKDLALSLKLKTPVLRNQSGLHRFPNGDVYEGEFLDGRMHGYDLAPEKRTP